MRRAKPAAVATTPVWGRGDVSPVRTAWASVPHRSSRRTPEPTARARSARTRAAHPALARPTGPARPQHSLGLHLKRSSSCRVAAATAWRAVLATRAAVASTIVMRSSHAVCCRAARASASRARASASSTARASRCRGIQREPLRLCVACIRRGLRVLTRYVCVRRCSRCSPVHRECNPRVGCSSRGHLCSAISGSHLPAPPSGGSKLDRRGGGN